MFFTTLFSFLLGGIVVVAVEVLVLYWYLRKLSRGKSRGKKDLKLTDDMIQRDLNIEQRPLVYPYEKQGPVWVLEPEKLSSTRHDLQMKAKKEQKKMKETIEVSPVKKDAKIKQHVLILTDPDGSQSTIPLLECNVKAVSSSTFCSRKWMKKYPIQIQSKKEVIYNGSKVCYLYLETAWEKEAWCKALRLASCSTRETIDWYSQLSEEFLGYLTSLNSEYPLFLKPSLTSGETTDKNNKTDVNSSRVRGFIKRMAKKASKFSSEPKPSTISNSNRGERKTGEKNPQDETSAKYQKNPSFLQDRLQPNSPASVLSATQSVPASCDGVWNERFSSDEGTVCLNMLFSRIFFDIQRSMKIKNFIKDLIQRTISSTRIPSYIAGINCTDLDLGCRPPYMHSIKALPIDMKEGWAVEVEIEYSGGFLLEIETRLEVRDPEVQKGIVSTSMEPNSAGDATSDLLEGLEDYSCQLNNSVLDGGVHRPVEESKSDVSRQSRMGSWTSRWRSMLHNVADHVSQVPISLEVRVASLRGTLLLQVKPPPSDQLWFCFTSMPEIDLSLNSAIGDHKIANTHVAMLISNRVKATIRESLVLPNYENICIPWMLAEKDDWLPRSAAPFTWIRQESGELTRRDASKPQPIESKVNSDSPQDSKTISVHTVEHVEEELMSGVSVQSSINEPVSRYVSSELDLSGTSSFGLSTTVSDARSVDEVQDDMAESSNDPQTSTVSVSEQAVKPNDEDVTAKKMGKKERMKDFGRKVSEKLDEKIRHIEEKGRQIVENVSSDIGRTSSFSEDETTTNNPAVVELRVPLLANADVQPSSNWSRTGSLESQLSTGSLHEETPKFPDETKPKKSGRRERMWDLGRKMSEKIDEKRRHIEERGRHIVEKMKEGSGSGSFGKSSSLGGSGSSIGGNTSFKE